MILVALCITNRVSAQQTFCMIELWQGCLSCSQGGCHLTIHTGKDLRRLSGISILVPKSEQIPHVFGFEKPLLPGITQDLQQHAQASAYILCMTGQHDRKAFLPKALQQVRKCRCDSKCQKIAAKSARCCGFQCCRLSWWITCLLKPCHSFSSCTHATRWLGRGSYACARHTLLVRNCL